MEKPTFIAIEGRAVAGKASMVMQLMAEHGMENGPETWLALVYVIVQQWKHSGATEAMMALNMASLLAGAYDLSFADDDQPTETRTHHVASKH
jgi:hypothetical protein